MVHDLEKRVQSAKNNVDSMSQLMTKWCEAPLYERKEGKKEGLLNIEVKYFVDQMSVPLYSTDEVLGMFIYVLVL